VTDVCNGAETCQSGVCTPGTPLNCNDGSVCTTGQLRSSDGLPDTAVPNGFVMQAMATCAMVVRPARRGMYRGHAACVHDGNVCHD